MKEIEENVLKKEYLLILFFFILSTISGCQALKLKLVLLLELHLTGYNKDLLKCAC